MPLIASSGVYRLKGPARGRLRYGMGRGGDVPGVVQGARDSFGFLLDATDPLESVAIGSIDPATGMKVAAIVAFTGTLPEMLLRPDNLATAAFANNFSVDRDRRASSDTSVGLLVDPYFTGRQDAGDGVVAGFADIIAIASGRLALKVRPATSGEKAVMGARSNSTGPAWTDRRMCWAHPTFSLWGAWRGNAVIEARFKITSPSAWSWPASSVASSIGSSGRNPAGSNWMLKTAGGSEASGDGTTGGEYDLWEGHYEWRHTSRGSGVSGDTAASRVVPDTLMVQRVELGPADQPTKVRSTRRDPTTLAQVGTPSDLPFDDDGTGGNFAAFWDLQGGIFNATLAPYSAAFADTDWAGQELLYEIHSLRVLLPATQQAIAPAIATTVATVANSETGTKVIDLPSAAALWGSGSWTESLRWMHGIDTNGPGRSAEMTGPRATGSSLPVGLTQDLSARTVTLNLGTFKSPGVVIGLLHAFDASTGFCRPHRVIIRVAPLLAIPQPDIGSGVVAGNAFSYTIPRDDGAGARYWDCGNLAFGAPGTGGLELVSKPAWMAWDAVTRTLSGTAPADITGLTEVQFKCTNGAGDVTTQTIDLVNQAWNPSAIDSSQRVWVLDPKDPTTVPGAHGATVGTLTDRYIGGRTIGAPGGAEMTINTAGGPGGAHRTLALNGSAYAWSFAGASNSGLIALFNAANFATGSAGYFAAYIKTDNTGIERFFQWCTSTGGSTFAYRHSATTRGVGYNVSGTARTADQSPDAQDTSWHVVEFMKSGATITVTIDGTDVVSHTVTDTGGLTAAHFIMGANRAASANTADWTGQCYRQIGLNVIPDGTLRTSIRTWLAAA